MMQTQFEEIGKSDRVGCRTFVKNCDRCDFIANDHNIEQIQRVNTF